MARSSSAAAGCSGSTRSAYSRRIRRWRSFVENKVSSRSNTTRDPGAAPTSSRTASNCVFCAGPVMSVPRLGIRLKDLERGRIGRVPQVLLHGRGARRELLVLDHDLEVAGLVQVAARPIARAQPQGLAVEDRV